jgi:hypothetical protein
MTTWPESLPAAPLLDGFSETPPDLTLRTQMEQGPAKTRRRTTAGVTQMTAAYFLTRAQVETLLDFYTADLSGGSLSFAFVHPRTGDNVNVRFRQPPALTPLNGIYCRVKLSLEVLP